MAVSDPTTNYSWALPDVGGDTGSWGDMLNRIFGDDGTGVYALGIDGVIAALAARLTTAESDITSLETRVTTLEAAPQDVYYGRLTKSGTQGVAGSATFPTYVQVTGWTAALNEGLVVASDGDGFTIPVGGAGLYHIHAQLDVQPRQNGDDCSKWALKLQGGAAGVTIYAVSFLPHLNDGYNANSGTHTISVQALAVLADADSVDLFVSQSEPGDENTHTVYATDGSYFELVRLGPST